MNISNNFFIYLSIRQMNGEVILVVTLSIILYSYCFLIIFNVQIDNYSLV